MTLEQLGVVVLAVAEDDDLVLGEEPIEDRLDRLCVVFLVPAMARLSTLVLCAGVSFMLFDYLFVILHPPL